MKNYNHLLWTIVAYKHHHYKVVGITYNALGVFLTLECVPRNICVNIEQCSF